MTIDIFAYNSIQNLPVLNTQKIRQLNIIRSKSPFAQNQKYLSCHGYEQDENRDKPVKTTPYNVTVVINDQWHLFTPARRLSHSGYCRSFNNEEEEKTSEHLPSYFPTFGHLRQKLFGQGTLTEFSLRREYQNDTY